MKNLRLTFLVACLAGLVVTSCQPDSVKPKTDKDPAGDMDWHPPISPVCGDVGNFDVVDDLGRAIAPTSGIPRDGSGGEYGNIQVMSSDNAVYMLVTCKSGWYCMNAKVWFGDGTQLPVTPGGQINYEAFTSSWDINPVRQNWYTEVSKSAFTNHRNDWVYTAQFCKLAANGSPKFVTRVWGTDGNQLLNGWKMSYTNGSCGLSVNLAENCKQVCSGFQPTACTDLTALEPTDGVGPYTYVWSDGQTGQNVTVCPTATTTYEVTVTDSRGITGTASATVNVAYVGCDNPNGNNGNGNGSTGHKVIVCHVPPGNPNNAHEICIDWSGVPAHVVAYATVIDAMTGQTTPPASIHNTGCKIGPCDLVNPCTPQ